VVRFAANLMFDTTALFEQLISNYWWLLPLLLLASLLKSPRFKGVMGEFMVNMAARLFLDKTKYHLIKNMPFQLTTYMDLPDSARNM